MNDKNFHELGNERDPIIGNQDGTLEFKIPKRPIRKKITGLPAFTTVRGGAYFFLPGIKALRYLAALGDASQPSLNARGNEHEHVASSTHLQPRSRCPQIHAGQTPHEHLLDVELPVGIPTRPCGDGEPLLNDDRSPHVLCGRITRRRSGAPHNFYKGLPVRWSFSTVPRSASSRLPANATGHPVAVFQRIDQAGFKLPIDERILADTDTLMVFGLDHLLSEQDAAPEEVAAIREWLKREGTCLLLAPHHDVGFADDLKQRQMEYLHHGDALVPRQQRFGQYTRSLMKALDVPVHNQWGLRPALVKGTKEIAPLTAFRDIDKLGLLKNVPTLNFHPHLPHYELTTKDTKSVHLLARQPIDPDRPHPFTAAGNTEFNCLLWMPPNEQRAGDIVLVGLDQFHDTLRRHGQSAKLLAELGPDEMSLGYLRMQRRF